MCLIKLRQNRKDKKAWKQAFFIYWYIFSAWVDKIANLIYNLLSGGYIVAKIYLHKKLKNLIIVCVVFAIVFILLSVLLLSDSFLNEKGYLFGDYNDVISSVPNISLKNPNFCELTGLYWAWKNLDANYIGLAHYRRHFCKKGIKQWLNVIFRG